jgi:ketosteroid isomerase-like protein
MKECLMDIDAAVRKAKAWCDAWNVRDLDAVMAHYAENVAVCSPLVVKRLGLPDGWLRGKSAVRDYFAIGMGNTALHFEFEDVRLGVGAMVVLYRRENGMRVSDTVELNAAGEITRMIACYAEGETGV